jgi:hypothetical protein
MIRASEVSYSLPGPMHLERYKNGDRREKFIKILFNNKQDSDTKQEVMKRVASTKRVVRTK